MNSGEYLEKLLAEYSHTFDITRNYNLDGRDYPAYGNFYANNKKYVLTEDVKLWEANSYEHIVFAIEDKLTMDILDNYINLLEGVFEPLFVRRNKKYPERDHMYTYISALIICNKAVDKEIEKAIKKYRFEKSYLFSIRGWANARLMCVDLEKRTYISNISNRQGADLRKLHRRLLSD